MDWYGRSKLGRIAKRGRDIIVDFDKTICCDAPYPKMGDPIEGVARALQVLIDNGYNVRIYTCRLNGRKMRGVGRKSYYRLKKRIENYLAKHSIPYTDIVLWFEGKPFGEHYIDDRNIPFEGDWTKVIQSILAESSGFQVRKSFRSETCNSGSCDL